MINEQAPQCCPFCHSARDQVLKFTTWSCGVRFKDQTWRTKECYKRNLASATRERDEARGRVKRLEGESESRWLLAQSAIGSCAEMSSRIKRLEEAGEALADSFPRTHPQHDELMNQWTKAKEATR